MIRDKQHNYAFRLKKMINKHAHGWEPGSEDCLCCLLADIECAKSYAKIAESAKTLASQQVSNQCRQFDVHNM